MSMEKEKPIRVVVSHGFRLVGALICVNLLAETVQVPKANAQETPWLRVAQAAKLSKSDDSHLKGIAKTSPAIPPGTILPVRLNSSLSFSKSKAGQAISATLMQDVPFSSGEKLKRGSKVVGHIVEVTPASTGPNTRLSIQFDKLILSGQEIPILTNLRAVTGFMGVREAQTPSSPAAEGDNFYALPTVQVGGDAAYGFGGQVTAAQDSNQIVGKMLANGVVGQVRAKEGTKCRGPIDGNDRPQALWVFSSDACGVYDLEHLSIVHAGRTDPTGVIVLASDRGTFKLRAGAGMLLRVNGSGK